MSDTILGTVDREMKKVNENLCFHRSFSAEDK